MVVGHGQMDYKCAPLSLHQANFSEVCAVEISVGDVCCLWFVQTLNNFSEIWCSQGSRSFDQIVNVCGLRLLVDLVLLLRFVFFGGCAQF